MSSRTIVVFAVVVVVAIIIGTCAALIYHPDWTSDPLIHDGFRQYIPASA